MSGSGAAIDAVAALTKDNAAQQKRIEALRPLLTAKFAELKETIDAEVIPPGRRSAVRSARPALP